MMKLELDSPKNQLRALPVQLIEMEDGIIVRRGCERLKVSGDQAREVMETIFELTSQGVGKTIEDICGEFEPETRETIKALVDKLVARRILLSDQPKESTGGLTGGSQVENSLEVFYWHFGTIAKAATSRINEKKFVVLGINHIAHQLVHSLDACGVINVEVVDHPFLRNLRLFDSEGKANSEQWPSPTVAFDEWADSAPEIDCLVVTSDFGGLKLMREWNQFCVTYKHHFFPIVLQDMVGYIGPLVVPGETPCFECLWARQNSHLEDPELQRASEGSAFYGQVVDGHLPPMSSILADIAVVELIKFYSQSLPHARVGRLIEVDLLKTELRSRPLLKIPRCKVCSPLTLHSSSAVDKNTFLPGNPLEE